MPKYEWTVIKVSDDPEQLFLMCTNTELTKNAGISRVPLDENTQKHFEKEGILSKAEIDALIEKAREGYGRERATMVEGTLDIIWENYGEPLSTPRYKLLFLRYQDFKGGGQPTKFIVGNEALVAYLVELNVEPKKAKDLVAQVANDKTVSISNLMIGEPHINAYEK